MAVFGLIAASVFTVKSVLQLRRNIDRAARLNIEALSEAEIGGPAKGITSGDNVSFNFNGQYWYGTKTKGIFNFFPHYTICIKDGKQGYRVECTKGKGNCWNGTWCIYTK